MKESIACLGAGRMGRGIAVVFAYAGHKVSLVDFKARDEASFRKLADDALGEVRNTLGTLASFGLFDASAVATLMARVSVVPERDAQAAGLTLRAADFERFREVLAQVAGETMPREALTRTVETDGNLSASELSLGLAQLLEAGVWGPGFPPPLFCDTFALESQRVVGDKHSDDETLRLPHPRAAERAFVLVPWLDLESDATIPGAGPVADLVEKLGRDGVVRRDDLELVLQ